VAAKVAAEPNQMALATADGAGAPSVRMVLLKGYDARGFIFYTNYDSRKAAELASGRAALTMYWEPLQRSVRALHARGAPRPFWRLCCAHQHPVMCTTTPVMCHTDTCEVHTNTYDVLTDACDVHTRRGRVGRLNTALSMS